MITDEVVKEIYAKYKKSPKDPSELQLDYFIDLLAPHHKLQATNMEIIVTNLEEFNPFRRFLKRSLNAVLEFDKVVAFVFSNHIVFFSKTSSDMSVNFKPEKKKGLFDRLFGNED